MLGQRDAQEAHDPSTSEKCLNEGTFGDVIGHDIPNGCRFVPSPLGQNYQGVVYFSGYP